MDKLQPILKNHFWVLLVPLFSMNLWGYFSANSELKAATTARQAELDSVKSGIPAGTTDPNSKYAEELKKGNDVLVKNVDKELLDLWNRQKTRMIWPASVAAEIPKVYKSEIKSNKVRLNYKNDYPAEKRKLHAIVEPYVADKRGITWTRKVDFPIEFINPHVVLGTLAIPSPMMWEAQEDLWLTQFILEAIREMNKDADSESSAVVRKVIAFRLLGGNGESTVIASEGAGGDAFSEEEAPMGNSGKGSRGLANTSGGIPTSVQFDPSEEFGTGGDPAQMGAYGRGGMISPAGAGEEGEGGEAAEPTGPLRYVKEDEAAPFVERGFYLSVIINQDKLVDFLVALSNSEWPVRIVRFHFGKNPYGGPDPFAAHGVSSGFPGGGGGFGMDDDGERKGNRGGGRGVRPMNRMPADDGGGGFGLGRGGGSGGMSPRLGGAGVTQAASTGYPPDALLQPDLVQLDLAGLITIYRQPKEEIPAEGEVPAAGETPAEESADVPADAVTTEPSAAPASEGDLPAEASSSEMVEPAGETLPAEEPVTATPATDEVPADTPPQPETPAVDGTPEPAAEEAPVSAPAADTPAVNPPVPEASPPEVPEKP